MMLEVVAPIRCNNTLFITGGHSEIYGCGMTQMRTAVPFDASAVNASQQLNYLSRLLIKGWSGSNASNVVDFFFETFECG